ncbi:activating signal cointegrator 1-like [Pyrus x bretschneideri]|uniref:activating signal cointegrator 1-like n=1 Tax=Pyrus x bretschneideri TaxID=225117 RepID=UPI00202E7A1B|nr:activating signal cointegrator 1-like [Pyrus x bretschneideri]
MRRGGRHSSSGNYRNPCLTMHQPWASLLVYGIKRVEGRSWPSPIRGRLWIHAAGKVPDEATIKAMEEFYREIYAVDGITEFPENYGFIFEIGFVEVAGCVRREELVSWELVPEGVRLEPQTDMCWLCEQPQKLLVPFEMRGYQGVYNLVCYFAVLLHHECPLTLYSELLDVVFDLRLGRFNQRHYYETTWNFWLWTEHGMKL